MSRHWSQGWGYTMTVLRQPSARYRLSSIGIAPCLQLAQNCAFCKCWHESDFSTWVQVGKFTTGLVPVPQKDFQYWRGTGIVKVKARPTTSAAPKGNWARSCPSVLARYWTPIPCQYWNLYWFSTGITPKSVVSRHLVSGLGLYYASTAPTLVPVPTV